MLVKRKVTNVDEDQLFYYAGRKYVLANEMERKRHPGNTVSEHVLAFHLLDGSKDRVPVSFNALTDVYVDTK